MIHSVNQSVSCVLYLRVKMHGTLKSFREQKSLIVNLLELFSESAFIASENDWPLKSLRGKSNPAATIAAAPIDNEPSLTELFETTLQGVFGDGSFPRNPAQAGSRSANFLQAKIQNGLVFGQENRLVWRISIGCFMR
jgi:hypothetical protein